MLETSKIYNEDCLETMAKMPNDFVDLTITSPPYNIGKRYSQYKDSVDKYIEWIKIVTQEIYRVSRCLWINTGYRKIQRGNVPIAFEIWNSTPYRLVQFIKWEYGAGMTYRKRFNHRSEDWLWLAKGKYTFNIDDVRDISLTKYKKDKRNNPNGKLPSDIWYFPSVSGNFKERTSHPAQFPEKLIERIIRASSNEGDLIYDPFMGSGTTAKMALLNNRKYVGSELSKEYCEIAEERIAESEINDSNMF